MVMWNTEPFPTSWWTWKLPGEHPLSIKPPLLGSDPVIRNVVVNHITTPIMTFHQNFQTSVCPIHWTYGIPLMFLPSHVMKKENQYMKKCFFCRHPFQLYNRQSVSHWLGDHIEAGELGSKVNLEICWYHLGEVVIGRSAYSEGDSKQI